MMFLHIWSWNMATTLIHKSHMSNWVDSVQYVVGHTWTNSNCCNWTGSIQNMVGHTQTNSSCCTTEWEVFRIWWAIHGQTVIIKLLHIPSVIQSKTLPHSVLIIHCFTTYRGSTTIQLFTWPFTFHKFGTLKHCLWFF